MTKHVPTRGTAPVLDTDASESAREEIAKAQEAASGGPENRDRAEEALASACHEIWWKKRGSIYWKPISDAWFDPAGLKALASRKSADGIILFVGALARIVVDINVALYPDEDSEPFSGLRYPERVQALARYARASFHSLVLNPDITPTGLPMSVYDLSDLPKGSRWWTVDRVLDVLADPETWPPLKFQAAWLEEDVLPELYWATKAARKPKRKASKKKRAGGKSKSAPKPEASGTAEA